MAKFEVTFKDIFTNDNEEECYEELLQYLASCVRQEDVTAFNFREIKE